MREEKMKWRKEKEKKKKLNEWKKGECDEGNDSRNSMSPWPGVNNPPLIVQRRIESGAVSVSLGDSH